MVADPEPAVAGWEEQSKRDAAERRRVSLGIRGACPLLPTALSDAMQGLYENPPANADERAEELARQGSSARDFLRRTERSLLMERACPGWTDIAERMALAPTEQRASVVWEGCKWSTNDLYRGQGPGIPPKLGERSLFHYFDFAVFQYLRDHGTASPLAVAVVRRLGVTQTADEPSMTRGEPAG